MLVLHLLQELAEAFSLLGNGRADRLSKASASLHIVLGKGLSLKKTEGSLGQSALAEWQPGNTIQVKLHGFSDQPFHREDATLKKFWNRTKIQPSLQHMLQTREAQKQPSCPIMGDL